MKTPIKWYGGKASMVADIAAIYQDTGKYIEPFAGGLSFYWHKKPSRLEVVSDINGQLVNFYRVLKSPTHFKKLCQMAKESCYAEYLWEEARFMYLHPCGFSKAERAWALWYLFNFSFGGLGNRGALQITCNTNDSWIPPVTLKNKKEYLQNCGDRMERTIILNKDALSIIKKYDSPDATFYLDPPYYQADQGHYSGFAISKFKDLLNACEKMKGNFILSSYSCDMLRDFCDRNGWNQKLLDKPISVSATSDRKIESIVWNYDAIGQQQMLFK